MQAAIQKEAERGLDEMDRKLLMLLAQRMDKIGAELDALKCAVQRAKSK
jgi:hypothetical protein